MFCMSILDIDIQCVHCLFNHPHTVSSVAALRVKVYTYELLGLCGILIALLGRRYLSSVLD
jgi:hypothetical protein